MCESSFFVTFCLLSSFYRISEYSILCGWDNNSIFCEHSDDIQGERKIRITKDGILDIYIAMDISDSVTPEDVNNSKNAVISLIDKVRTISFPLDQKLLRSRGFTVLFSQGK